jgi:hypothetical protein
MKLERIIGKEFYLQKKSGESVGHVVLHTAQGIEGAGLTHLQERSFHEIMNASRELAKTCQGCLTRSKRRLEA